MPSLFNQQISATYKGLLKTTSNGILTSSLAQITDGNGNGSQLYLSNSKINFYNAYEFPTNDGSANQVLKTDGSGVLTWEDDANTGGVTKTGTIALNTIAVWNDNADQLRSDTSMSINTNGTISLLQPNSVPTDVSSYNIGGGNIANVTGQNNTGFGQSNMQRVTTGTNNVAFGNSTLDKLTTGSNNTVIGKSGLFSLTEGDGNTGVGQNSLDDVTTGSNNTAIGKDSGSAITTGSNNVILGSNTGSTINTSSNNIIISDGSGNNRIQVDSGGNVGIGISTIESYWSGYTALKVGYNNSIFGNTADSVGSAFFISQNLYNDGSNYRYVGLGSDEGGLIDLRGGAFVFSNAPLGTAGNVASIVPRLTISSGGVSTFNNYIQVTAATSPPTSGEGLELAYSSNSGYLGAFNRTTGSTGYKELYYYASKHTFDIFGVPRLTITSGGVATFSGSVTTPFLSVSDSASQIAVFNGSGTNGAYLSWQTSGTTIADLGTAQQIFGSGGNDTFGINARGARSLIFGTNNAAKLTISSGGNVAIGGTLGADSQFRVELKPSTTILAGLRIGYNNGSQNFYDANEHFFRNGLGTINRLTISSVGAATFSGSVTADGGMVINGNTGLTSNNYGSGKNSSFLSSHASQPQGILIHYTGASPNGTGNLFIECHDNTAQRFTVRSNGGVANYSGNNVNLSDESVKKNITDTPTSLNIIKNLEVKDFQYIDQTDDKIHTGVIAQQVLQTDPSLVDQSEELKMVYNTDLMFKMLKAIQEQQTIIEDLKSRIETLEE